jgi:precorrin-4 methylase
MPDPKVYFIGAGPGAADLITIRGAEILRRVRLVLYAGSLVSRDLLALALWAVAGLLAAARLFRWE